MSKTLIVGDPHLGAGQSIGKPGVGFALNSRTIDKFNLFDWILDISITNNVSCIIFTGDMFEDPKPDTSLILFLISWLKRCSYADIKVHIIAGNHDIKRSGSHYISTLDIISEADINNIFVHKDITTIYNETSGFTLLPFRDRRSFNTDSANTAIEKIKNILNYELEDIPKTYDKILIGHLSLEGAFFSDEIDDSYNELMFPLNYLKKYNYVWFGHVHKPQVMCYKPYIAHIGSLDISNFGEAGQQKIVVLFDSESNSENKFSEIKVPSRQLRHLKLLTDDENPTKFLLKNIEDYNKMLDLNDSIFKIEIQLQDSENKIQNVNRNIIYSELYNKYKVHHVCSLIESRITQVVPLEKRKNLDNTIEPKSAIKMWAQDKINENEYNTFIKYAIETIEECDNK